jgi:hypothetical protein
MEEYMCYTYIIGWTKLNKYYYGVRTANTKPPEEDLWKEYFTSSNIVHDYSSMYGDPDLIKIDKVFDNKEDAIRYEHLFLKENFHKDEYLNLSCWPAIGHYERTPEHREKARQTMQKLRESGKSNKFKKGYTKIVKEETRKKMSETRKKLFAEGKLSQKGENNSFYGKQHSKESLDTIHEKRKKWLENNKGYRDGGKNPAAKSVCANGVKYGSVKEACTSLDITYNEFKKRVKNDPEKYYYG